MGKTEIQKTIIRHVWGERITRGLGQKNIADLLGISEGQVGNIESPNYSHKYTLKQLDTLCKAFGIPTESLFLTREMLSSSGKRPTELLIEKIIEYENK